MYTRGLIMENKNFVGSTSCTQRIIYLNHGVKQGNPNQNAKRCGAKAKSTGLPCKGMAMRNKVRCRLHGGRSTGAKSAEGKAKNQQGNFKHGFYSVVYSQNQKSIKQFSKYLLSAII